MTAPPSSHHLSSLQSSSYASSFLASSESEVHLQLGFDEGFSEEMRRSAEVGERLARDSHRRAVEGGPPNEGLLDVVRRGMRDIVAVANGTKVKVAAGLEVGADGISGNEEVAADDDDDDDDNWLHDDDDCGGGDDVWIRDDGGGGGDGGCKATGAGRAIPAAEEPGLEGPHPADLLHKAVLGLTSSSPSSSS